MYYVPPAGRWWPAVGAPLEREVRPHWWGAAVNFEVHCLGSDGPEARRPVLRQRVARWSGAQMPPVAELAAVTDTMPLAVQVGDAALMGLAHDSILVRPNVRAKRETTVARQARAVENAPAPRTGPGGLPLALRLSEGLGLAPFGAGWPPRNRG